MSCSSFNEDIPSSSSSSIKSRVRLFEELAKTPPAKKPLRDHTNVKQQQQTALLKSTTTAFTKPTRVNVNPSKRTLPNARSNLRQQQQPTNTLVNETSKHVNGQQQQQQSDDDTTTITSNVLGRKQLFEAIGQQNKKQNQVLQTKTFMNRAFDAWRLDHTTTSSLCLDGLDDDLLVVLLQQQRQQRLRSRRTHVWKRRIWQVLYAMLAMVELVTLLPNVDQETHPTVSMTRRGLLWRALCSFHVPQWWHDVHTALFVAAVCIETIMTAWDHASQGHYDQQTKQDAVIKQQHTVTKRTRGRIVRLETTSTNRHVIARWTHNRIRWSRATTEILKWALLAVAVRFMFVPVLRVNPFLHYFGSTNNAKRRFFFGRPIRTPKQQPIQDSEQLLSVAEAIFYMFHSTAITKLRNQVKAFTVKMVKRLLSQPWKVSARVQRIFKTIRWAKFLAPLIGTCNKLRGEYCDFRRKKTQRQRSRAACQRWDYLLQRQTTTTATTLTMEQAARLVQRRYRAKTAPKSRYLAPPPTCLLLRPNTDFAVRWKRITIACVLVEIVQLSLAPKLAPNAKKVPIEALVTLLLTPSLKRLESFPWLQMAIPWISLRTAEMVSTVSFLDVFVSFFTGELDAAGRLVPKDIFTRWILPGVALQLIVNPTLKDVAHVVGWGIALAQRVGPMRALHILVALMPMVQAVLDAIVDTAFVFVYKQNRRDLLKRAKRAGY